MPSGRDQQLYTVAYSTVADPGTFVNLAAVNFNPAPSNNPTATRVSITEDALASLATGVAALRFTFDPSAAPENGYTGYTEIDVFGTPVPEPTALGALGLCAVAALSRRRSRHS